MYRITALGVFLVFAIDQAFTACPEVKVEGVTVHPQVDGEYKLYGRCGHLDGSLIYQKKGQHSQEQKIYLYYYTEHSWKGWIFSNVSCSSLAFVRLPSNSSSSPEVRDSGQTWEELDGNGYRANQDISIYCIPQKNFTTGIIILLSLLCAIFVVLLTMAPVFWIKYAQRRKPQNSQTSQQQTQEDMQMSVTSEPPPYTPAGIDNSLVFTAAEEGDLPPYTSDNITLRESLGLQIPQPPAYDDQINDPPPSYDCSVISTLTSTPHSNTAQAYVNPAIT